MQHAHPFISAMVNNGTLHYDHDRDGTHTQLAGCEAKFRNVDHDTYVAIRYENNKLTGILLTYPGISYLFHNFLFLSIHCSFN